MRAVVESRHPNAGIGFLSDLGWDAHVNEEELRLALSRAELLGLSSISAPLHDRYMTVT